MNEGTSDELRHGSSNTILVFAELWNDNAHHHAAIIFIYILKWKIYILYGLVDANVCLSAYTKAKIVRSLSAFELLRFELCQFLMWSYFLYTRNNRLNAVCDFCGCRRRCSESIYRTIQREREREQPAKALRLCTDVKLLLPLQYDRVESKQCQWNPQRYCECAKKNLPIEREQQQKNKTTTRITSNEMLFNSDFGAPIHEFIFCFAAYIIFRLNGIKVLCALSFSLYFFCFTLFNFHFSRLLRRATKK